MKTGKLVISLDFELFWGVKDTKTLDSYGENIWGVRAAIPALLELFKEYEIHATWATVGFLFAESREQLAKGCPTLQPTYVDKRLSTYGHMSTLGSNEEDDPYHFAPDLIRKIISYPYQRIGTHTFSHYYCLEPGQNVETFRSDIEAACQMADYYGLKLESLVFPRNQVNPQYIGVLQEFGFAAYRGNPASWMYRETDGKGDTLFKRAFRLMDAYWNLSGYQGYRDQPPGNLPILNIPASRFLRPYCDPLSLLEGFRLKRILAELTDAAREGKVYHLWWHPHNFGTHLPQNLQFLKQILDGFANMRKQYGMESLNMEELAERWLEREQFPNKKIKTGVKKLEAYI